MTARHHVAAARDALRLRQWALAVLGGAVRPPPPAGDDGWRLFLSVEGCALPLQRAGAPPPSHGDPVMVAASAELTTVLAVRMQMLRVDPLAARLPGPTVVLKGGVAAAGPEPLHVSDVDVLVAADHAPLLGAALEALGHAAAPDPPPGVLAHHLGARSEPRSLPVEVHFALPVMGDEEGVLRRSVPLPGYRALRRPAPLDHLRQVLVHVAAHHPERRGRVRDLALAAQALRECDDADAAAARRWAATAPHATDVLALLAMVEALAGGRVPPDPYRGAAAGAYLFRATRSGRAPSLAGRDDQRALNVWLGGAEDRREYLRRVAVPTTRESALPAVAALARRAPAAGTWMRVAARGVRLALALARVAPVARAARRLERAAE